MIGWWIGAEDRWYIPEREITIRQTLVQGAPVVMTAIRIPGGDATHTVYGSVQGPRELAVIEIANKARAPIVGALTISGPGARHVSIHGSTVRVDGFPLITLPRAPMRTAAAADLADLAAIVEGGRASEGVTGLDDGGQAFALLLPVSQATSMRCSVLVGASSAIAMNGSPVLTSLPDIHTAAAGWGVHLARGPRIVSPERDLGDRLQAVIGGALLAAEPAIASPATTIRMRAVLARAFDAVGLHAEAGALLDGIDEQQGRRGVIDDPPAVAGARRSTGDELLTTATVVEALAHHAWITGDAVFAETFAPAAAGAVEAIVKATRKDDTLKPLVACAGSLVALFTVANDSRAAKQARAMWERFGSPWPIPSVPLPSLPASSAGGSFVPDDPLRLASAIRTASDGVAQVGSDGSVDLFAAFQTSWRGSSFEARNVPVPGGRLSAAVRWHGARPALLWEVDGTNDITLTCLSLDATWSANGRRGDALLAAPA